MSATSTAVPGITSEHLADILAGPKPDEATRLPMLMHTMVYGAHGERDAATKTLSDYVERSARQIAAARAVATNLGAMSDAEKAAVIADEMTQVAEVVSGYRATLVKGGFTPAVAEQMSMHMHAMMMQKAAGATQA